MRKGERIKSEILQAAASLIIKRGETEKVTLSDVADCAHVPPARIVYYFKNRRGLLEEIARQFSVNTEQSPYAVFLEKNRHLLNTIEGKRFFINDLFRCLYEFYRYVPGRNAPMTRLIRIFGRSRECSGLPSQQPVNADGRNALAFHEIYRLITGDDDLEKSFCWFLSIFTVLEERLSDPNRGLNLGPECPGSEDFNIKCVYFCRKQLMIGLGLWEKPFEVKIAGVEEGTPPVAGPEFPVDQTSPDAPVAIECRSKKGLAIVNQLLEAAVDMLAECGDTEKISIRKLAAKVGMPASKVIYHFQTRENFLQMIGAFLRPHVIATPVQSFLAENREMLRCKEGQALFMNSLFANFRSFFMECPERNKQCCNAFRALMRSEEMPKNWCEFPRYFMRDLIAFREIYLTVTHDRDIDTAMLWYLTTLDAFALRCLVKEPLVPAGNRKLSADFNLKFLYFCSRQMLSGLGLWEVGNGGQGDLL